MVKTTAGKAGKNRFTSAAEALFHFKRMDTSISGQVTRHHKDHADSDGHKICGNQTKRHKITPTLLY